MTAPPRRISDRVLELDVAGYLLPARDNHQPVFASMPGTDDLFILLFSTADKLKATMKEIGIAYDRVKQVCDGGEFIQSIRDENVNNDRPYAIRIAVDAHQLESGNVRYVEILTGVGSS